MSTSEAVEDLEYSPEFQALRVAAAGTPERAMGESVIPAEPPDWSDVRKKAKDLVTEPPHLEVLVHLARSETNINGFAGLKSNLSQIIEKLNQFWDQTVPLADEDDEDDPHYQRINLLHELAEDDSFTDTVHRQPLVEVRGLGSFSTRDIAISRGLINGSEEEVARCQDGLIRGAFQESGTEYVQNMADSITAIPALCTQLEQMFAEKAGTYNQLSLTKLIDRIGECQDALFEMAGDLLQPVEEEETAVEGTGEGASKPRSSGSLASREAVSAAFDRIIEYYVANEPSSPVPLLIVRARDMVPKGFFQVLQELAPAKKDNFEEMLATVMGNPLAYLVNDSYRLFTSGELIVTSKSEPPAAPPPEIVSAPPPPVEPTPVIEPPAVVEPPPTEPPAADPVTADGAVESQSDNPTEAVAEGSGGSADSEPGHADTVEGQSGEDGSVQSEETMTPAPGDPAVGEDVAAEAVVTETVTETVAETVTEVAPQSQSSAPEAAISEPVSQKASREQVLVSVDSRMEVLDVLGDIDSYFAAHEPSSAVPLVVAEIRKLVSKNFGELLQEISRAMSVADASDAAE